MNRQQKGFIFHLLFETGKIFLTSKNKKKINKINGEFAWLDVERSYIII